MTREEIEAAVAEELRARKKAVVNRNAWDALFATVPGGTLVQLFRSRARALDDERAKIRLELVLDLLLQFDAALSDVVERANAHQVSIAGFIEAHGTESEEVSGVRIHGRAKNVEIDPGTRIRATGQNVRRVTGLDIGDE